MIIINNKPVTRICKGNTEIVRVNRGNDLVYEVGGFDSKNYQEVEYIYNYNSSSAKSYINLGIYPELNERIEVKSQCMRHIRYEISPVFGTSGKDTSTAYMSVSYYYLSPLRFQFYWIGGSYYIDSVPTDSVQECVLYYDDAGVRHMNVNGNDYKGKVLEDFTFANPYYLFAVAPKDSSAVSVSEYSSVRIYYFRIFHGDKLAMNLVPCKRRSDNVVGMYDTVTKTFFGNSGGGYFRAGNDVN